MSNDPAAPDESDGQLLPAADSMQDAPGESDALAAPYPPAARMTAEPRFAPERTSVVPGWYASTDDAAPERLAAPAGMAGHEAADRGGARPAPDAGVALGSDVAPSEDAAGDDGEPVTTAAGWFGFGEAVPGTIGIGPLAEPSDPYADMVPASLELGYVAADAGLSDAAYERSYPYEAILRKRRHTAGSRVRKVGRELAETVILALLIFFAVKAVVQNFRVEGASMEPSMHNDEYLLVNKALYFRADLGRLHDLLPFIPGGDDSEHHLFRAPRRGDVIVFKFPLDPTRDFIKRVIGVPGDTVEVRDETVFINGNPLSENYIKDKPNYTYGPKTVPAGMYYVLGDNRRNSFDSHAWGNSCSPQQLCDFVPEENIIGQAWVSYWPFDQLGFINNKIIKPQAP